MRRLIALFFSTITFCVATAAQAQIGHCGNDLFERRSNNLRQIEKLVAEQSLASLFGGYSCGKLLAPDQEAIIAILRTPQTEARDTQLKMQLEAVNEIQQAIHDDQDLRPANIYSVWRLQLADVNRIRVLLREPDSPERDAAIIRLTDSIYSTLPRQ